MLRLVKRSNRKQLYQAYVGMESLLLVTRVCDTSHKQQITRNPKTMAQQAPRDRTKKPLPEPRVGTRGVFYQGGFCYIYLERGEQPIRCSDTRPNLGSIIRRIRAKGYLVRLTHNPTRLLREDSGEFKVLLGNRRTVYMLTIYNDTLAERKRQPKLFERNQRGDF